MQSSMTRNMEEYMKWVVQEKKTDWAGVTGWCTLAPCQGLSGLKLISRAMAKEFAKAHARKPYRTVPSSTPDWVTID